DSIAACGNFRCYAVMFNIALLFFSSRRRHTRFSRDWSSDVCSSDLTFCRRIETRVSIRRQKVAEVKRISRVATNPSATRKTSERSEERRVGKESKSRAAG